MGFTFVDIEERKTKLIWFIFSFLVLFYFFTAIVFTVLIRLFFILQTDGIRRSYNIFHLTPRMYLLAFLIAIAVGILHWFISLNNCTDRILKILRAQPPDKEDRYHNILSNIIDEVSVATGGKKIECVVVPALGMNAFSISDLKGRSIIGVTEGVISRLSRPQIEAVVAHEAAHIITQDTLIKTIAVSLFSLYGAICGKLMDGLKAGARTGRYHYRSSPGEGGPHFFIVYIFVLYIVSSIFYAMTKLMSMLISRQCEYRADAVAVRLNRDPLSLAQALYRISRGWRAGGMGYDMLESLFIMNPNFSKLDEREGVFSGLFSTHPPSMKRIGRLLDLGHGDFDTMAKDAVRFKRPRSKDIKITPAKEPRWLFSRNGKWQGPFRAEDIMKLSWLNPETFIKREGANSVGLAWQDDTLSKIMNKGILPGDSFICPRCKVSLSKILYEGAPVYGCSSCGGMMIEENKLPRIITREEQGFSDRIIREAEMIKRCANTPHYSAKAKFKHELPCPKCKHVMLRHLYTYAYPVEVDTCSMCKLTWFDKYEMEVIQYLIEQASAEIKK